MGLCVIVIRCLLFFLSSRRRHTRFDCDWSSDVCSSDLNRAQQDAFLPWVENGIITLIGATTENPSFELTAPLLSRCRVFVFEPLKDEHIRMVIERALRGTGGGRREPGDVLTSEAIGALVTYAQ